MAEYGSWEDRPWERREGRDWDRWLRERHERRREGEPWREREHEGYYGAQPRGAWRDEDWGRRETWPRDWRAEEEERRMAGSRMPGWERNEREREWGRGHRGWPAYERGYRTYGGGEERWGYGGEGYRYPRELRQYRPEGDRPWVERGPMTRGREPTRGLVEWEDRGPLEWLGHKIREATGRPGRGPKGYKRSDERIHDEVCERIARSGVEAEDVEVKVSNGEVTLSGTVAHRQQKWWLENLADDVFGVEEVHNHLRVARPEASERAMTGKTTTH